MPMIDEDNYTEWLEKAEEDEISAKIILKENGPPSTACFLLQQMAEKQLKALLVLRKKSYPKVHDLLELETRLLDIEGDVHLIHHDLELLNRYYIETRYPGDYPEFTLNEAKQASEAAQRVKEFVIQRIANV